MNRQFNFQIEPFEFESELDEMFGAFDTELADQEWEAETSRHSPEYIRWGQRSLNQILGLRLAVDGILGRQTRSAIRKFQQREGLMVDGIIGDETKRALIAAGATSPPTGVPTVLPMLAFREMPRGPFGVLTIVAPEQLRYTYAFTPEDALWTARFIVGEAGGRDDPDNRAVIWAMLNRYAFFTHKYYKTFHSFLRAYSTPLQPVLPSWGAARRHMHKPEFIRTGDFYQSPPAPPGIPRGQLKRFLKLQATPWSQLPESARSLAEQALRGQVPNPIGNASEFASTRVFFHDKHGRYPSDDEWRQFTEAHARKKGWIWIGPVPGLNQKKNVFFVQKRAASLPKDTARVVSPGSGAELTMGSFQTAPFQSFSEFDDTEGLFDEYEEASNNFSELEEEFSFVGFPETVLQALRNGLESVAIRLAIAFSFHDENTLTNLVFFARHPERKGKKLEKGEPRFKEFSQEWLDIRDRLVRPALKVRKPAVTAKPSSSGAMIHPNVNTQLPSSGPGYYGYYSQSRKYGLPETIQALQAIGAAWQRAYPQGPRIGIGDISLRGGGPISGHKSHRLGVDIDIQPMRNDGLEQRVRRFDREYSRSLTQELINLIHANGILGVSYIFFNDPDVRGVSCEPNHDNHLHVRLCAPDDARCKQHTSINSRCTPERLSEKLEQRRQLRREIDFGYSEREMLN
jgi:Penicillin-insensitive murein endopeptidase/Putative peptidoglycan binding domain